MATSVTLADSDFSANLTPAKPAADEDEEDHALLLAPGALLASRLLRKCHEGSIHAGDLQRREDAPVPSRLARPIDERDGIRANEPAPEGVP